MFRNAHRIWIAVIGLLFLMTPVLSVVGTAETTDMTDHAAIARAKIDQALEWLKTRQLPDGSWLGNPGITAMGVTAFLNRGIGSDDPAVAKALDYIIDQKTSDGSFTSGTNVVYETSLCIVALSATRNPEYKDDVKSAINYLASVQKTQKNSDEEWWVGGIGYGGDGRPDLSNNQFALMAFHAAYTVYDIDVDDSVWENGDIFTTRCQNLVSVNPDYSQQDTTDPSYNDGGFIYFPGYSHAGGQTSYGSMTTAGLWCYLLGGVSRDDRRVEAAVNWLEEHYTFAENPGVGQAGLYYYYWTFARAMTLYGEPISQPWYEDMVTALIQRQSEDGSWVNQKDWWWESMPELSTLYAINALETAILPWTDGLTIEIELHSDKFLHVLDDEDQHSGNGKVVRSGNEEGIPGSKVTTGSDYTKVVIENADAGTYRIGLTDGEEGWYELKVTTKRDGKVLDVQEYSGEVSEDAGSRLVINSIAAPGSVYLEEPAEGEFPELNIDYPEEKGTSYTPIMIGGIAALLLLIIISIVLVRRKQ